MCKYCGVELKEWILPELQDTDPKKDAGNKSIMSLAQSMTLGSYSKYEDKVMDKGAKGKKLPKYAKALSNIGNKLEITRPEIEEILYIFIKLHQKGYRSQASRAKYAIVIATRRTRFIPPERIDEAIRVFMNLKYVPDELRLFSEFNQYAEEFEISTKIHEYYYLWRTMWYVPELHKGENYKICKEMAIRYYKNLSGNAKSRAKRAVGMALAEMGVSKDG